MIRGLVIRPFRENDVGGVRDLNKEAFGRTDEARLVEALREAGDDVLELVATHEQELRGHILFSRLIVESAQSRHDAVALAPISVRKANQGTGIGRALIESAHHILENAGEALSVVLGEPGYYGRFGYMRERAEIFESDYHGPYLLALPLAPAAPSSGRLVYPSAFADL